MQVNFDFAINAAVRVAHTNLAGHVVAAFVDENGARQYKIRYVDQTGALRTEWVEEAGLVTA